MTIIDAHGRNRHAAGSPASIGGQYAAGGAPGAAAMLEAPGAARVRTALDAGSQLLATLRGANEGVGVGTIIDVPRAASDFARLYSGSEHQHTAHRAFERALEDDAHWGEDIAGAHVLDAESATRAILAEIDAAGTAPAPVMLSREYSPEFRMDGYAPDDWTNDLTCVTRGLDASPEFTDWLALQSETDRAELLALSAASEAVSGESFGTYREAFEKVQEKVAELHDAQRVPPPAGTGGTGSEGYMGGSAYVGASAKSNLTMAEAGRKIRKDLLTATKTGYLPAAAKLRVVQSGGGSGWYVDISGIPRELVTEEGRRRENSYGREVEARVAAIARQFESSDRNSQYDYFSAYRSAIIRFTFDD